MPLTIALVGTGPTGIYTFRNLIEHKDPLSIWLFEKGESAGIGMPYSPEMSSRTMLANIASIEIPELTSTYLEWLEKQTPEMLHSYGLNPKDLNARQFTPRLLLGEYYRDQLMVMVDRARAEGHLVMVCEEAEVTDIALLGDKLRLSVHSAALDVEFDRVILATGHVFPDEEAATAIYFPSPWSGLIDAQISACTVGIMGTSLSAIDAAMAVACQHGTFHRNSAESLHFTPTASSLRITMMSWTGVLPEADFYCPYPYTPLTRMTAAALKEAQGLANVLDTVFHLFQSEILAVDPDYAESIGLMNLTADSFAEAYFAERRANDPFRWARENLEEVERNKREKFTVPWRYAILRMHEQVEDLVPQFTDADRERFDDGLKKVFVDNYAAVPSESIRRLLALRDAGVLEVLALGDDYALETGPRHTVIKAHGKTHVFDVFIDARGQKALATKDLPFPSLRAILLEEGCDIPQVDEDYSLLEPAALAGRISFGAIPYLMHDHPFAQGITAAADIGAAIARTIHRTEGDGIMRRRRRVWPGAGVPVRVQATPPVSCPDRMTP